MLWPTGSCRSHQTFSVSTNHLFVFCIYFLLKMWVISCFVPHDIWKIAIIINWWWIVGFFVGGWGGGDCCNFKLLNVLHFICHPHCSYLWPYNHETLNQVTPYSGSTYFISSLVSSQQSQTLKITVLWQSLKLDTTNRKWNTCSSHVMHLL